jgi:hypothetical protein
MIQEKKDCMKVNNKKNKIVLISKIYLNHTNMISFFHIYFLVTNRNMTPSKKKKEIIHTRNKIKKDDYGNRVKRHRALFSFKKTKKNNPKL